MSLEECPNSTCRVGESAPSGIGAIQLPPGLDWGQIPAPTPAQVYTAAEVAARVVPYAVAMLFGVLGNVLLILIVVFNKRMHSMTNLYVANLAMSDLIVSGFCMWVHLGKNVTAEWPFGQFICKFNAFLQAWVVAASVFFLTVIAGDRFFAIVYPMGFRKSRKWSVVVFVVTWVCAAGVAAPHLFYHEMQEIRWLDRHEIFCEEVVLFYFCPFAIMSYTFGVVTHRLWHRKVPGEQTDATILIQKNSRKKVIRMLVTVLTAFFICWTPFQVIVLYDAHRTRDQELPGYIFTMKYAFTFMGYLNSSINPILYGALNSNFQQGFKDALHGTLCKRFHRVRPAFGTTEGTVQAFTRTVEVSRKPQYKSTPRPSPTPGRPREPTTDQTNPKPVCAVVQAASGVAGGERLLADMDSSTFRGDSGVYP